MSSQRPPASRNPRRPEAARPRPPARTARPPVRTARPPARQRRPPGPPSPPILDLLLVPVLLTLGVTVLRVGGERLGWPAPWFSRLPGGGLAIVGISWLPPLVGAWLGFRLGRAGLRPTSAARAAGVPLVALAIVGLVAAVGVRLEAGHTAIGHLLAWGVAAVVGTFVAIAAWPVLGRSLLVYAFAARLPVVGVMWLAIQRRWGTHYDAPPPGLPSLQPLQRWLWTGVLPQLTIWVAWTVITGALGGVLGWLLASRLPSRLHSRPRA